MEGYGRAKLRIFERQHAADTAVLNDDDPWVAALGELPGDGAPRARRAAPTPRRSDSAGRGCAGDHNRENVAVAAALARAMGATDDAIVRAVAAFRPVPHRLEHVGDIDGVSLWNDSKATNVDATLKALTAFAGTARSASSSAAPTRAPTSRRWPPAWRAHVRAAYLDRPGRRAGWRRCVARRRRRDGVRHARAGARRGAGATRSRARRCCSRRRARRSTSSRATRRAATASARSPRPAAPSFRPDRTVPAREEVRPFAWNLDTWPNKPATARPRRPRRRVGRDGATFPSRGSCCCSSRSGLTAIGQVMVYSASSPVAMTTARYGNDPLYFVKNGVVFTIVGVLADAARDAPAGGAVQVAGAARAASSRWCCWWP